MADSSQEGSSQSRNPSPARDRSSDGESDGATKPAARASSGTRCTGPSCSRWAMTFKADEPWTHHRLCGTHLVCTPSGAVCAVCSDWSAEIWKAFKAKDLQLQKKRDYRAMSGKTRSQSPAKAREPVPPVPSPIVLDSPDPSGAEAPHGKKKDVRRTSRPSRTHKKKKRKYSSPSSSESSSPGSSPGTSPDRGRRHRSPSPRYSHHSRHRSRRSRSGERRPTASVSATPARPSGSGLPADGALLEQLLQQTFSRFSAAKTALPPFPYPGQGPAAATAPAPAAVAQLPKGLTPEEERAVMLMRAAPLVAPPSITRMLTPPHHGTLPRSPSRSAQPQATDDEEVLSEHSGLEVHAQDDGLLDRDIEMQVEEPIPAPTPPPRPVPVQPALDTVSLGDPDDLPGDVNAWRATWAGEKFKFRVPARIQETRRQIVQALGLKTEETDKVPESTNRPAQTRSLFADVPEFVAKPYVVVPMDPITVSIASRDAKDILGGSTTALGASTFAKKFPITARDERECLTPQKIDPDAIAYIKLWINPDFNPQKPFGNAQPHLAAADKLCKRVEERTTSLARLSAFQVQVQAFLHHVFLEQEAIHRALREDPLGNLPPPSGDFPPEAVRDAMECSAFLTASINRIALHMQAEVRLDNRARLLQSVVPGRPGFPVYNRKDLLALPLNSDLVFAGKFSETVKATTDTQEVAFQAQRLSQGLLPAQVASTSGYRIPKKSQGRKRSSSGQAKTPTTSDHGAGRRDPPPQGHPPKKESSYSRRGGRGGGGAGGSSSRGRGGGRGGASQK